MVAVLRDRLTKRIESTDEVVSHADSPLAFNLVQRDRSDQIPFADRRPWMLLMLEFWLHAIRQPELMSVAADLKADLRAAIASQIEQLLAAAKVKPPLPPELLASALIALEDGFALQELLQPDDHPSRNLWDVLDFFAAAVMEGAETRR